MITPAETIIHGGRIATLDWARPLVSALAIARGRVLAIGDLDALAAHRSEETVMIDLKGRTVVPGLNDSHLSPPSPESQLHRSDVTGLALRQSLRRHLDAVLSLRRNDAVRRIHSINPSGPIASRTGIPEEAGETGLEPATPRCWSR
jgi:imidazolonepropionase-like amidohydrolase